MREGLLALVPLLLVAASCRVGVAMWGSCSVPPGGDSTGTDGTYVLVCRGGIWEPTMTNRELLALAQGKRVTIAPLPKRPTTSPTTPPPTTTPQTTATPSTTTPTSTTTTTTPPVPDSLIATGFGFSCAASDGAAKCWGANNYGQLGAAIPGSETHVPTQVQGLTGGVTAIAAGYSHACAVVDGAAKCWGDNQFGQLGATTPGSQTPVPTQVQGLTTGVTAISAGRSFTCAVVDGAAECWGRNDLGQLGSGTAVASTLPTQVQGLTTGVTAIAAGDDHACAVVGGAAKCWGFNDAGQLGDGAAGHSTNVPTQVHGLTTGVTAIATGTSHSCAVVAGAAKCWGQDDLGELGDDTVRSATDVPSQVHGLTSDVTAISAGDHTSCAVVAGAAKCWGWNYDGQLGNAAEVVGYSDSPVQVTGLLAGVTSVSTGPVGHFPIGAHTCAVVDRGIRCWGLNDTGQLGAPSVIYNSADPIVVPLT